MGGPVTKGFPLPLDAKFLILPVTYAATAFSYLVYRSIQRDPETGNLDWYMNKEAAAVDKATYYNNELRGLFAGRVSHNATSLFWRKNAGNE